MCQRPRAIVSEISARKAAAKWCSGTRNQVLHGISADHAGGRMHMRNHSTNFRAACFLFRFCSGGCRRIYSANATAGAAANARSKPVQAQRGNGILPSIPGCVILRDANSAGWRRCGRVRSRRRLRPGAPELQAAPPAMAAPADARPSSSTALPRYKAARPFPVRQKVALVNSRFVRPDGRQKSPALTLLTDK
jgi:hypothetical protein